MTLNMSAAPKNSSTEDPMILEELQGQINRALDKLLPTIVEGNDPLSMVQALREAVLLGGKRLRPCITLAASKAVSHAANGADSNISNTHSAAALHAACAVELIHCYSLVHDDMPAMDDDDLRRGHPTCHKKYGEATALLVGDALLTYAFELLGSAGLCAPEKSAALLSCVLELARGAGVVGMVGGQALDLALKAEQPDFKTLERCHNAKTAALFCTAAKLGALVGGGTPDDVQKMGVYGEKIGLAFQHADDLQDQEYLQYQEQSLTRAKRLSNEAAQIAKSFGPSAEALVNFADFVHRRAEKASTGSE